MQINNNDNATVVIVHLADYMYPLFLPSWMVHTVPKNIKFEIYVSMCVCDAL